MQNKYISEEAYYNSMNKNPVYVVLMNGGTPLSKIISGFTGDTYTHACISFNAKLKPLYSFGLTNDSTFGFAIANPRDKKAFPHIDKYAVYVMYVSNHQLYKMKKRLKWFIDNGKDLKFDFPALVSVFFQKDTENHSDKYFCSRFVAEILKMGEVDLEKKASLYRPESLLALSNISLVNWGRDIIGYNWIKTRDNERLIKQNRYVHPTSLIPKFESGGNDLYEETHWDTLLTKPKLYFNKKVTMYHYSNTNKDIVVPLTVNAGNKLAKPRFSSWWTPYKSNAGWALSYVIFNTFKESKWKDVLWHVETMTIDGMTYRAPRTIISESFYKSHEDFIKSIDVYEHQKTFNGSDLGRGNEYSVDEYTCDFAVKPDRVRRISWDEMLEIIKIVPDDEFQLYRKELNDMWVHGKTFQDLVHEKKPWLYWEFDVSNDIRARYCKEHNIQFKIDEEYFRFTYHGGGIYEELKQHVSPNVWRRLLTSSNFKWLPKPDYYSDTCTSWFTKEGKDQFVKKVLPICEKYLGDEIEYTKAKDLKNIVYKDRYQVVVDPVTNTNESVVYDDRDFDDILEEDSKYDYDSHLYGKEYARNLHKVDILKTRLKQGKITQEEFDKEYEKIKPSGRFKIKPSKDGAEKVEYKRPNKNKPEGSAKKLYKGETGSRVDGDLSKSDGEKFDHYNNILQRTENYNDYKTAFRNMARLLGKPNASAIKVDPDSFEGHVNARCYTSKKSANCTADTKLYHTSETKGLTRLNGKFRSKDGICYSSKRVYFHKGKPGSRMGESPSIEKNEYVYEFIGNPSQAYVDPELNGTAVFIETDTSVPVKDVTDQFKNKEVKESADKSELIPNFKKKTGINFEIIDMHNIRAKKYLRSDKSLCKNMDFINKARTGEIAIDKKRDKLAGYIFVSKAGTIQPIHIYEDYRGYGLSETLLKDGIQKYHATNLGVYSDNQVAINLYKKFGFKQTKEKNYKDGEKVIFMELDDKSLKKESVITESKSNKHIYFISDKNMDGKVLSPRIPDNYFTRHGYEDTKIKRVCFTPSIDKSLMALSNNITGKEFYVHIAIGDYKVYKPTVKQVPDSKVTGELWVTKPIKVSCIGKIKVISDMGLPGHKFSYGDKEAELYDWKWEWVEKLNDIPESYMEEDSKYDFYTRVYGKEYTKNLHRVEILKTRLKQGKITQEEFDKEYEKIKPASSFKIKPDKNGAQKVDYNRPNKNKSDNSAKKIYKGNPDSPRVDGDLSKVDGEKFDHYASILMRTENYNDYKTAFRNMARLLGKPNASAIRISDYSWKGNVECRCYNSKKSANCGSDIKLYHTSETRGLTRLNGRFRSKDGVYYSSKRVYFHKGKPGSRIGGNAKENNYIYEFIGNPSQAYVDPELGSTAVFIETDTSVPVKDVTDQFRNKDSKEIKESCYKLEETMLYEFANKELLDKIHVTSDVELSKWMKSNIKYQEFKTLMTPEEVFESRMGSCHDQVVFELAVLKALKYSPKALFFIEYNEGDNVGGQTHSFVYYRRGTKFYWFENAWGGQAGIHGPYKNLKELKNDIISKHDTKKYKKLQFASFKGKEGMTLDELVKACLK